MNINLSMVSSIKLKVIYCISLFTLFIFPLSLSAQNPILKNYTTNDGLPSYEVFMAHQDKEGYMWFSTNYGVCRFDGNKFESFDTNDGLAENTVFEIFEDYKGRIWFLTSNFKLSYWYKNRFYMYKYNESIKKSVDIKPYIESRSFYVDSLDNIYFSITTKGAFKINKQGVVKSFKSKLTKDKMLVILNVNKSKAILSCTSLGDSMLYYENLGSLQKVNYKHNSKFITKINLISSDGYLYFSQNNSIFKIKGNSCEQFELSDNIISIDEDKLGNIWVGFRDNGTKCYPQGDFTKTELFHLLKGLPVTNVIMDHEYGLWITTTTSGVFYTPSLNFITYNKSSGLGEDNVSKISVNKDSSFIALSKGAAYLIDGEKCNLIKTNIPAGEKVEFATFFGDYLWLGTNKMSYKIKDDITTPVWKEITFLPENIKNSEFIVATENIYNSNLNEFHIATKMGIIKVVENQTFFYKSSNLLIRVINMCKSPDGKLYFSSYYGVGEQTPDSLVMLSEKYPKLKARATWVLCNPEDASLWIGTKGEGIFVLKDGRVSTISKKDGLCSEFVKHMVKIDNEIWVATNNGISRIFLNDYKRGILNIQNINQDNGFISNDINQIGYIGKNIYAATDKGVIIFNSENIDTELPKRGHVKIFGIKINEKDTLLQDQYSLPYNTATITISFGYLSFLNAGKQQYKYRILGLSDEWKYTSSTEVRLTTLPPGKYTIEIYAVFSDGTSCHVPGIVNIEIKSPFWQEWWFYIIVVTFSISVIFIIFILRINQINRKNKTKYQLFEFQRKALASQMNPHFIFNSLNSIQLYILKNDVVKSNKYLGKFSSLMRTILVNSSEPSVTLENEINTLSTYLELESLRFDNKFSYEINVDPTICISETQIPTLLIQPFVENAIWHGLMNKTTTGKLTVEIFPVNNNSIKCIITDDGIGREKAAQIIKMKSEKHKSMGAKITEERLVLFNSLYNNKLKIHYNDLTDSSGNPSGTKVEIIIPIIK